MNEVRITHIVMRKQVKATLCYVILSFFGYIISIARNHYFIIPNIEIFFYSK